MKGIRARKRFVFDSPVTFREQLPSSSRALGTNTTPAPVAREISTFADRRDMSGAEAIASGAEVGTEMSSFIVRREIFNGLPSPREWSLTEESGEYDIRTVERFDERGRFLRIRAVRRK